jgi:hypothetical protein
LHGNSLPFRLEIMKGRCELADVRHPTKSPLFILLLWRKTVRRFTITPITRIFRCVMQTNTGYVLASMAAFAFLSSAVVAGSSGQAGASASRPAAQAAGRATTAEPAAKTPARNEAAVPAESKRVRWSLTSGGSQRRDWLVGNRFDWPEFNARNVFGLPDWLSATFE